MDKSILFHVKYTIAVVKFKLHQGQIHGLFALCIMFRSLQFTSAHSLRFASPRISLAVCMQPKCCGQCLEALREFRHFCRSRRIYKLLMLLQTSQTRYSIDKRQGDHSNRTDSML